MKSSPYINAFTSSLQTSSCDQVKDDFWRLQREVRRSNSKYNHCRKKSKWPRRSDRRWIWRYKDFECETRNNNGERILEYADNDYPFIMIKKIRKRPYRPILPPSTASTLKILSFSYDIAIATDMKIVHQGTVSIVL